MSIDGVLIHFLIFELKKALLNKRVKSFFKINNNDFFIAFQNNLNLFITLNNNSHFRLNDTNYPSSASDTFTNTLRRHIDGAILSNIYQFENDRIAIIDFKKSDELGYVDEFSLIFEFFGRHSNLILINKDYKIIDCFKKTSLEYLDERIIQPKLTYIFPISIDKINPYKEKNIDIYKNYLGFSKILKEEIFFRKNMDFIYSEPTPCIIKKENKLFFHVFELTHLNGEKIPFSSISTMLEYYFKTSTEESIESNEFKKINNYVIKEIKKIKEKIFKQENELKIAKNNLEFEKIGNLIISNLHNLPEHSNKVVVLDYYTNENIEIDLNQNISVKQNAEKYFKMYKKAKRTVPILTKQIEYSKNEIVYFEEILSQIKIGKTADLKEVLLELKQTKPKNTNSKKLVKPNISIFTDYFDNKYYVGKNNIQNDYLSSKIAKKTDYFFHVKNYSGSHTILKGVLNDDSIFLAATLASYFSSASSSQNVAVDYTEMKNVKKIPGIRGSFVRYSNYKTVYVTPNYSEIKKLIK